jgi:hypothetical protein
MSLFEETGDAAEVAHRAAVRLEKEVTYSIAWSEADHAYVGRCLSYPSFQWFGTTRTAALQGVQKLTLKSLEKAMREEPTLKPRRKTR